jgi:lactoylglutathione lyase
MKPGPSAVFDHQAIHVRDLSKSVRFYETVLGLKRTPDPFRDAVHAWLDLGHGLTLHVIAGAVDARQEDMHIHLAFTVPDMADFITHLDSLQVHFANSKSAERQVTTRRDGVKQIYLQDPDGYWIEVNDAPRR